MCRKLGKGHPDYINRLENKYVVVDGVKKMRRAHNGQRIDKHHGHNVLNAWCDMRDKFWSWFPQIPNAEFLKVSAKKAKQLRRMDRHTCHGMTRNWAMRRAHLQRNNICVLSYQRDKNR